MYNENSRKNLKLFSSQNQPQKRGRPKGSVSLTNSLVKALEGYDEKSKKQVQDLLAAHAIRHAMRGNAAFFKLILERTEGKVPIIPDYVIENREIARKAKYVYDNPDEDDE